MSDLRKDKPTGWILDFLLRKSNKLLRRREMTCPPIFEGMPAIYKYEALYYQNPMPVGVDFWREELHHVCTTLILDDLLSDIPGKKGEIYLMTLENTCFVENYVNLGLIEMISSGIKYKGSFQHNGFDVMALDVDAACAKDRLSVPHDCLMGFEWYAANEKNCIQKVATSVLGGKILLNFAVCGEFNLYIFFHAPDSSELIPIFMKSYCCK